MSEFDVTPEEAMRDAEELAENLASHGILLISDQPIAKPDTAPQVQPATMSALMQEMSERALRLGVPFSAQLDLTYRCNEQCVHCYLDHRRSR